MKSIRDREKVGRKVADRGGKGTGLGEQDSRMGGMAEVGSSHPSSSTPYLTMSG